VVGDHFNAYYTDMAIYAARHGAYSILTALISRPPDDDILVETIQSVTRESSEIWEQLLDDDIFSIIEPVEVLDMNTPIPVHILYMFAYDKDLIDRALRLRDPTDPRSRSLPVRFDYDIIEQFVEIIANYLSPRFTDEDVEEILTARVAHLFSYLDPRYLDDEDGIEQFIETYPEYAHLYEVRERSELP